MGTLYEARCPCGYQSELLAIGGGMSGPDSLRELAICAGCEEVVAVRVRGAERACPRCRRGVTVIEAPGYESPARACPRCGETALRIDPVGDWD